MGTNISAVKDQVLKELRGKFHSFEEYPTQQQVIFTFDKGDLIYECIIDKNKLNPKVFKKEKNYKPTRAEKIFMHKGYTPYVYTKNNKVLFVKKTNGYIVSVHERLWRKLHIL